jgi:putative ABC transport system ATP-binding protein
MLVAAQPARTPRPPPSEHAVVVRDVTKVYGSGSNAFHALKGVSLAVRPGELVMLSGPSGSGKTTLLSILGCVLTATSGHLELLGEDISRATEAALPRLRLSYVGFVFQSHNLIQSLSARENIALLLRLRGYASKDADREADKLLDEVGLLDKVKSRPRDLSGGQRQRVAIARALAGSPPLILADEPTAALDAQNGLAVTETLRSLAKEHGHTVIVVTHDNRIFHLGDRIVHIEDGLIVDAPRH